jgi:hypothetical protein
MPRPSTDLLGKRFSRIVVLKLDRMTGKGAHWHCRCDCGREFIRRADAILNPRVKHKSCGCVPANPLGSFSKDWQPFRLPPGESECRRLHGHYRKAAKDRGIPFNIDLEFFRVITKGNCFYCGVMPGERAQLHPSANGRYTGNGVDRIDNSLGYSVGNCVPCCEICNKAKRDLSLSRFAEWVKRISGHYHSWSPASPSPAGAGLS